MALSTPPRSRSYAPRSSPLATADSTKTRTGATPSRIASATIPGLSPPRSVPPIPLRARSHTQLHPVDHGPFPSPNTNPACTHPPNIDNSDLGHHWLTATSPPPPPPFSRTRTRDVVMPVRARPGTAPGGTPAGRSEDVAREARRRRRLSLHASKSGASLNSVLEEHEEKDMVLDKGGDEGELPVLKNEQATAAEALKGPAWRARWLRFLRLVYSKNGV